MLSFSKWNFPNTTSCSHSRLEGNRQSTSPRTEETNWRKSQKKPWFMRVPSAVWISWNMLILHWHLQWTVCRWSDHSTDRLKSCWEHAMSRLLGYTKFQRTRRRTNFSGKNTQCIWQNNRKKMNLSWISIGNRASSTWLKLKSSILTTIFDLCWVNWTTFCSHSTTKKQQRVSSAKLRCIDHLCCSPSFSSSLPSSFSSHKVYFWALNPSWITWWWT